MNTIRKVQGMVAIAALAIGVAGVGRAQSPPPAEQKKAAAEKKTEAAPKPAAEEAKKKGTGEGIQVHGHWTIEVKDPDGKVATHREFENSLVGGASGSGSFILSALLNGAGLNGGWSVVLADSPSAGSPVNLVINSAGGWACTATATNLCSTTTLTSAALGFSYNNGFSLTGQIASAPAGSITQVSTSPFLCGYPNPSAPFACIPGAAAPGNLFTGQFTSATLATPIPVAAGQTVQATVQITFM